MGIKKWEYEFENQPKTEVLVNKSHGSIKKLFSLVQDFKSSRFDHIY